MLNKGYALIIDVLTTPTCMVMVASTSATKPWNETSECAAKTYMVRVRWELFAFVMEVLVGNYVSSIPHT